MNRPQRFALMVIALLVVWVASRDVVWFESKGDPPPAVQAYLTDCTGSQIMWVDTTSSLFVCQEGNLIEVAEGGLPQYE